MVAHPGRAGQGMFLYPWSKTEVPEQKELGKCRPFHRAGEQPWLLPSRPETLWVLWLSPQHSQLMAEVILLWRSDHLCNPWLMKELSSGPGERWRYDLLMQYLGSCSTNCSRNRLGDLMSPLCLDKELVSFVLWGRRRRYLRCKNLHCLSLW